MTKPRLVKVRALLYVLHHIKKKEAAPILTQPLFYVLQKITKEAAPIWVQPLLYI